MKKTPATKIFHKKFTKTLISYRKYISFLNLFSKITGYQSFYGKSSDTLTACKKTNKEKLNSDIGSRFGGKY